MKCNRIEKYLYLLSDGSADPEQEAIAREHLRTCEQCSQLFAFLQLQHKELTHAPDFIMLSNKDVDNIIATNLYSQNSFKKEIRRPLFNMSPASKIAFVFSAALFFAFGSYFVFSSMHWNSQRKLSPIVATAVQKDQSVVTAANIRQELAPAVNKTDTGIAAQKIETSENFRQKQDMFIKHDSAAKSQYAIAENILLEKKFDMAAHVLEYYLTKYKFNADSAWFNLGYCYTMMQRYSDAVNAYRNAATVSVDGSLMETALHRTNKILYLKLAHYKEARKGIENYQITYPNGKWLEEELYFQVKVAIAENDFSNAESLALRYSCKFPKNCRGHELSAEIKEKKMAALKQ